MVSNSFLSFNSLPCYSFFNFLLSLLFSLHLLIKRWYDRVIPFMSSQVKNHETHVVTSSES